MEPVVCALIPAFNEARHIAAVIEGARRYVAEVVVIDDGSDDGTGAAAREAGATCLRLPERRGKALALRAGLAHLDGLQFTHVLFLDGDGQHSPDDIPALLNAARGGADLVLGTRRFDSKRMPRARFFSNTVGSRIASWLVGCEIADSQCGFRLARLEALRRIKLRSRKYEFEMEVLIKMIRGGAVAAHAPVTAVYQEGRSRSKMKPVRDTVRICLCSLAYRFLDF